MIIYFKYGTFQAEKQKTLRIVIVVVIVREDRLNKGGIQCKVCSLTSLAPRVQRDWICVWSNAVGRREVRSQRL